MRAGLMLFYLKRIINTLIILVMILAMIPVFVIAKNAYHTAVAVKKTQEQISQKEEYYLKAVKLLTEEKWAEAVSILASLKDYKDAKVLWAYTRARQFFQNRNYYQALRQLQEIPRDYHGKYAQQIVQFQLLLDREYSRKSGSANSQGLLASLKNKIRQKATNLVDSLVPLLQN